MSHSFHIDWPRFLEPQEEDCVDGSGRGGCGTLQAATQARERAMGTHISW